MPRHTSEVSKNIPFLTQKLLIVCVVFVILNLLVAANSIWYNGISLWSVISTFARCSLCNIRIHRSTTAN